jgi:lipopolysaccharide biosynthesis protein
VLRPAEDPAGLVAPDIHALLHMHLLDTDRAANLLVRLQANRLRFDLLISTDTAANATLLRVMLGPFDHGAIHVVAGEVEGKSALRWLLSELQRPGWSGYDVIGHLHHGSSDSSDVSIDFQLTALLGGRQPMLDRILHAFAYQPALGLVFPSDPLLLGSDGTPDYPAGGMFWARRATLDRLIEDGLTDPTRVLPWACEAAGLTEAVTHVPGVFR